MYGIDSGNGYVYGEDETVLEEENPVERKDKASENEDAVEVHD